MAGRSLPTRRTLLASLGASIGSISGCLRLEQEGGTPTSGTDGQSSSQEPTARTAGDGQTATSTPGPRYPELELTKLREVESSGRSSPVSDIARVNDDTVVTVGAKDAAIYSIDSLSKVQSVPIPDVINFNHHGVTVADGDAYVIVGGSTPTRVIRISPTEGALWTFEEDHFGPNTSRNLTNPVVTDDYVIFLIGTTENREGDNDSAWFILDRNNGELVEKPEMGVFEDETCYATGIAETEGTVLIGGCADSYFYDLDSMDYAGSIGGALSNHIEGDNGVFYTGISAINASDRTEIWQNLNLGANRDMDVTDRHMYTIYNNTVNKIQKDDGLVRWQVTLEDHPPRFMSVGDESVWISSTAVDETPGELLQVKSGNVAGAYTFDPEKTTRVTPEPYDILHVGNHLLVGSPDSIIKYEMD